MDEKEEQRRAQQSRIDELEVAIKRNEKELQEARAKLSSLETELRRK